MLHAEIYASIFMHTYLFISTFDLYANISIKEYIYVSSSHHITSFASVTQ